MERKLDLSRLTDEEAKHVWEVIQRDFNLRKTEEQRLGELKTRIEKEDSKRELLGAQTGLGDSMCICCLQPFKFLLNSKRQCLDCQLYTCKACSRYNKKEHGWVCDNCRMTRVLKMGTLGWYHDNVRNRFKRFGSAKVMRSLYKRLNGDGRDDDTQSMPDVRSYLYNGIDEEHADMEAQRYKVMRKNKRLLSVHPMDFDNEEYFSYSRRPSVQVMQEDRGYMDYDVYSQRAHRRKSLDRYNMRADDFADSRMVRTRSLSKISAVARQQYVDTSDEEDQRIPVHGPYRRRQSRGSQEQAPPITELNKRMFAIENLLTRLEEKIGPEDQTEEEKLRQKLSELAGNLSERNRSSDDETNSKMTPSKTPKTKVTESKDSQPEAEPALSSSSDEGPSKAQKVYISAGKSYDLEGKLRRLEQSANNRFGGTTDSDLSELEDVVARTAARVQSAESEVSDIESKLAALSSGSKKKRKKSTQDFMTNKGSPWKEVY
ncbi:melanophilin a isoform X2 [Eucyclogobius newberryi]|uniref:melanophilin a isoform X2 n=1 Tax=Eucyclogobius newberryi TaxID=166745 RepID=UPI003B5C86AC